MEDIYIELGHRLTTSRQKLRLSQEYIADYVGLSRTSVTNIEKGRQRVSLHVFAKLSEAIGETPADLLYQLMEAPDRNRREIREWEEPIRAWVNAVVDIPDASEKLKP